MLSKLFNSARSLLIPTPQTQNYGTSLDGPADTEMVTTRAARKSASQEDISEDSIMADMPRSSRKRSRKAVAEDESEAADEQIFSTPAKKQKALPLREKDEAGPNKHTRVVVEIPVNSLSVDMRGLAGDFEESADEGTDQEEREESETRDPEQLEIADSESDGECALRTPPWPILPSRMKNAAPTKDPTKSGTTPVSIKPKHKRFGSEEPELEPESFSAAVEILASDEEDSDDDDAPEVVGAQDAMEVAQSKAREAAKAVEEQETTVRKKRQERDARLRAQADTAAKKRKREAEKASKKSEETKREVEEGIDDAHTANVKTIPTPLINRSNLPDLLPDEYLQDDSESDELEDSEPEVRKKPQKAKFADLVEKYPKDRRKGSTTYRVSKVRSKNLAPKYSFHTKSTKESWLMGRAGKGPGGIRKVATGGFLKKK